LLFAWNHADRVADSSSIGLRDGWVLFAPAAQWIEAR
jgi:hypothetical protein